MFLFPLSLASASWRAPEEGAGVWAVVPAEGSVRGSGAAGLPAALSLRGWQGTGSGDRLGPAEAAAESCSVTWAGCSSVRAPTSGLRGLAE